MNSNFAPAPPPPPTNAVYFGIKFSKSIIYHKKFMINDDLFMDVLFVFYLYTTKTHERSYSESLNKNTNLLRSNSHTVETKL